MTDFPYNNVYWDTIKIIWSLKWLKLLIGQKKNQMELEFRLSYWMNGEETAI